MNISSDVHFQLKGLILLRPALLTSKTKIKQTTVSSHNFFSPQLQVLLDVLVMQSNKSLSLNVTNIDS